MATTGLSDSGNPSIADMGTPINGWDQCCVFLAKMYIYIYISGSSSSNKIHSSNSSLFDLSLTTALSLSPPRSLDRDQMKNLSLVAAAVVLLLTVAKVQGIRLDAESHDAFSNQMVNVRNRDSQAHFPSHCGLILSAGANYCASLFGYRNLGT
jgi:hypothetical protein